ncbi:hypothetical protein [Paenibacillus sp. R14(2021)]|uniref:Ger(x)C family spore germination protein n=1 Tax=Paenibacillus sp. R14(2021) TaxID=2859228 RepID=UPI001C614AF3|nr:hypothetical protein [Paenibacillus sp. R14(2021)]
MKGMRNGTILVILAAMAVFIVGCLQTKIIEKVGIILAEGIDLLPQGRLLGTSVLYRIDPEAKEKTNVIVSTAKTSQGLREAMNAESVKPLVTGQIRLMIFGNQLAKKGIFSQVDMLLRDPQIGSGVYLSVASGQSNDILTRKNPEVSNIGKYLSLLIQHNVTNRLQILP